MTMTYDRSLEFREVFINIKKFPFTESFKIKRNIRNHITRIWQVPSIVWNSEFSTEREFQKVLKFTEKEDLSLRVTNALRVFACPKSPNIVWPWPSCKRTAFIITVRTAVI